MKLQFELVLIDRTSGDVIVDPADNNELTRPATPVPEENHHAAIEYTEYVTQAV